MGSAPQIEFWFSIGSTYTYLTVCRLEDVARAAGVAFDWRPFSVRQIMLEQDNVPFATKPVKAAYMWRDIERQAASRGLSPRLPAPYPLTEFDRANKVALVAREEGWCPAYARHAYRLWFEEGFEAGGAENLRLSLEACGQDAVRVLARAGSGQIAQAYEDATSAARRRGIFGVPSFVVGSELFWGDDRLEDAVAWALAQD